VECYQIHTYLHTHTHTHTYIHTYIHIYIHTHTHTYVHTYIQAYTDGSKSEAGVGSGIAVFTGGNLKTTLRFRLNVRCTNNQAEQMEILKALEYIQQLNEENKTALVYTDNRITLQLLQNRTQHTYIHT